MLIVIDFQEYWNAARDTPLQVKIIKAIRAARCRNEFILLVKYWYYRIVPCVLKELRGYRKRKIIYKNSIDGSSTILSFCKKNHISLRNTRVCGVETNVCVCHTAKGMLAKNKNLKITIIKNACGSSWVVNQNRAWDWTKVYHRKKRLFFEEV